MKRFSALIAVIFAVSILIGMQVVRVAEANPYWIWKTIDPVPGAIPPTITVLNPKNYTTYSQNEFKVNFVVSAPTLNNSDTQGRGLISDITYSIDNGPVIQSSTTDSSPSINPEYETNVTLPSLPEGNHNLIVRANGLVLIDSPQMEKFYVSSSSIIFFTIGTPSTVQQRPNNYLLNPEFLTTIAIVIVIVAVASISLVYFKRHKPSTELIKNLDQEML